MIGITVNSNKSLVGQGSTGIIKGKGLRMANGVKESWYSSLHRALLTVFPEHHHSGLWPIQFLGNFWSLTAEQEPCYH